MKTPQNQHGISKSRKARAPHHDAKRRGEKRQGIWPDYTRALVVDHHRKSARLRRLARKLAGG